MLIGLVVLIGIVLLLGRVPSGSGLGVLGEMGATWGEGGGGEANNCY